ncbi:MAG: CRTAC1 family protein [Acidimicrobiales bacterium]
MEPPLDDPPSTATKADLDGLHFTDVTTSAGLDARQSTKSLTADMSMTSGAAVADVDGDGDADIYVTRIGRPNSLYINDGRGHFTDTATAAGVDRAGAVGSSAAAFADIDADGCPDLYVSGAGDRKRSSEAALLVNDCNGHFTDETAARGVSLPATDADLGPQGHGVTFADYDHDGFLDLLVLHWDPAFLGGDAAATAFREVPDPSSICERIAATRAAGMDRTSSAGPNRSRLFHNDGTGHFTDVTQAMGLPLDQIAGFTGQFVDVDGDGWEDLAIAGDFCTSRLFHNDAGQKFVDVTASAGVGTDENGMGSVLRDIDGDGHPDWFVTSIALRTRSGECPTRTGNTACSGNRLYVNQGDGTFRDLTDRYGVRNGWWGWGAAIEDFADDGRLQIAQTNGFVGEEQPRKRFTTDPMRFWVPSVKGATAGAPMVEAAKLAGLGVDGVGHGLVAFDADGDGDLDLLVANFGDPPNLFRNDRRNRHWLTVRLDDPTRPGNRQGIGARVVVTPVAGEASTTGWIGTDGSYESQRMPELHVGLGRRAATVATVEVWWPGATTPQVVADVRPDRVLTVTRSAGP